MDVVQAVSACSTLEELEIIRLRYLGKAGEITQGLQQLKHLSAEERKVKGEELNRQRDTVQQAIHEQKTKITTAALAERLKHEQQDITLKARMPSAGTWHLLTQVIEGIVDYFQTKGFVRQEGPEIEDTYHNFDALNMPLHHPARQMQDTFFIGDKLLRTHTSTVQIRYMKTHKPPFRIFSMGRVYRADSIDATHAPMFHQLEGLVIEENVHMGHLKGCVSDFLRSFIEAESLRFRPSFFPFTEPSAEVDIWHNDRWLELLGCGMVHPNVLRNCGIDPSQYRGFAFGMGIERLTMLKYNLTDLRDFFTNDVRFLQHYA